MPQLSRQLQEQVIRSDQDPSFRLWAASGVLVPEDTLLYYKLNNDFRSYEIIEDDPVFGRLCEERRESPSLREVKVYSGGGKPEDELAAEIVRKTIDRLNFDHLCSSLNHAIFTGRTFAELIWGRADLTLRIEDSDVDRECYIPVKVEPKDPARLIFGKASDDRKTQHHMGFEVKQTTFDAYTQGVALPIRKAIVHSYGSLISNPYGKGVYRRLYWLNNFKKEVLKLGLINSDGRPIPVLTYDKTATPAEIRDAERMLEDFYKNSWMLLPESFKSSFATSFVQGQVESLKSFLTWFDTQASMSILGATLTSQTDNSATRGDSSIHYKVTESRAKSDSDLLSESLKEYFVKPIVELNCPGASLPFVYRDFSPPPDKEKEAKIDRLLFDLGYRPTPDRIKEIYGENYLPIEQWSKEVLGEEAQTQDDRPTPDNATEEELDPIDLPDELEDDTEDDEADLQEWAEFGWIIKRKLNFSYGDLNFAVGLEFAPGDIRFPGKRYSKKLRSGYGHLRNYVGKDKEALDAYIDRSLLEPDADRTLITIWAIEQIHPDGSPDELKLILGARTAADAIDLYLKEMPQERLGGVRRLSVNELKGMRRSGVEAVRDEDTDEFGEGRYGHINFTPPQSVRNAARRGLEIRAKQSPSNRGGLDAKQASAQGIGSGVARARDLSNGRAMSPKTVRRMKAFFDRHSAFKHKHKSEPEGKAATSWKLWGGDAGYSWAKKICAQMDKADESANHSEYEDGAIEFKAGDRFKHKKLWRKAYNEAKLKFKVFPSAYSSAYITQVYKRLVKEAGLSVSDAFNYGDPDDEAIELSEPLEDVADFDLKKWFKEEWVRVSDRGDVLGPCGDRDDSEGYPKCMKRSTAESMSKEERASAVKRKRRKVKKDHSGKPIHVSTHGKDKSDHAEPIEIEGKLMSDSEFDRISEITEEDVLAAIGPVLESSDEP